MARRRWRTPRRTAAAAAAGCFVRTLRGFLPAALRSPPHTALTDVPAPLPTNLTPQPWCAILHPVRLPPLITVPSSSFRADVPGAPLLPSPHPRRPHLLAPARGARRRALPPCRRCCEQQRRLSWPRILAVWRFPLTNAPLGRAGYVATDTETDAADTEADGKAGAAVTFSGPNVPITLPFTARSQAPLRILLLLVRCTRCFSEGSPNHCLAADEA